MNFLVENWHTIAVILAIIIVAIVYVIRFFRSGKSAQLANVKEWLLYATTQAEKEFGSGTGKIKLRSVYDKFCVRFPWLAKVVTFSQFSSFVDDALKDMNNLLATNTAVQTYVNGEKEVSEEAE